VRRRDGVSSLLSEEGMATVRIRARANHDDRRWSVRAYLLLLVIVAAVLLLISGTVATLLDFREARRVAQRDAAAEADLLANDLSESIMTAQTTVEQTLATPDLAAVFGGPPGSCNLAGSSVGAFSSADVHLLGPGGEVFCSSAEGVVGEFSYQGEEWVELDAASGMTISQPFTDPVSSRRAVAVVGPVVDSQGEVAGSFAIILRLEDVAETLKNTRSGRGRPIDVTVADSGSGEILSSSELPDASGTAVAGTPFENLDEAATTGLDGRPRLYGTSTLEESGWEVIVGSSEKAALDGARSALWRRSGSGLVILLFLIAIVGLIYRRIARPIAELSSGIRAGAEDPSPQPIAVKGPAEVVHLANTYNSMIETRMNYERRLIQAQKMDAVGQLAGGIAHDFNNLLAAVISYGHLLGAQLRGDPREDDARQIVRAAERGTALIRRLLTFSKRESDRPRVVSIASAVGTSAQLLRQVVREDITFNLELDPESWNVMIDPVQLEQVLVNLVVNARDAMPAGGTITIRTENRPGEGTQDMVALSVADSGEGIDPAIKDRIFEPFFTTKPEERGTGLGLAVVNQVVNRAAGSIEVTSAPNAGTVITVLFPRETADEEAAKESEARTRVGGAGQTILVVEDEEIVRDSTVRILQNLQFTVLSAGSGTEALRVLGGGPKVDLLLTDLVMPDMSGITLAAQAGLPVLFMSGYADSQLRNTGLTTTSDHIEKPFSPQDLVAAIHRVLDDSE
jgi:signal transduction histidine kinase